MVPLVTGASGFIGSHVLDALLAQGVPARALVCRSEVVGDLRERGVEVLSGDIRDPELMMRAVRGVDVVYHCAAAVGPAFSPRAIYDVSLSGTRNLLDGLRQGGTGRAVLLTSVNVLGTRRFDDAAEELPCRRSGDASADVKVAIEEMTRAYEQRHGVDVTILRPGLVYGPRDRHNVPQMIRALRRGKFVFIGSRDNAAPIVYVSDVVQAMLLAGQNPASRGHVYHITDGSRTTIGQFVDRLAELIDCPPPRKVLPYAVPYLACVFFEWLARLRLYRGRPPIVRNTLRHLGISRSFGIERARKELGYVPQVQYQEGLRIAVRWIEEQSDGHAPVS